MTTRRRRTVAAAVVALMISAGGIVGIGRGGAPAATADPACSGSWAAAPAGFAAWTVDGGALCWTDDALLRESFGETVAIVGTSAVTLRGGYSNPLLVLRDAVSGAVRWTTPVATRQTMPANPRDDAGLLVLPAETATAVVARDVVTGAEQWRLSPVAPTGRPLDIDAIIDAGPTVYVLTMLDRGDFTASEYETIAVVRATGAVRWRRPVRVLRANDRHLVAVTPDPAAYGFRLAILDPVTGAVRRDVPPPDLVARFRPDEAGVELSGDTLLGSLNGPDGAALVAIDAVTGAVRWRRDVSAMPMPIAFRVSDGLALVSLLHWGPQGPPRSTVQALDPLTGAVRWERSDDPGEVIGSGDGVIALAPPRALDSTPRAAGAGEVQLLDASSGVTLRSLPQGPWRARAVTAAIGAGVVLVGRGLANVPMGPPLRGDVARFCEDPALPRLELLSLQALPPPAAAAYVPTTPIRLFDSRDAGWGGYQCPGERLTLKVTGQAGIPASGVTAVALNLTLVGSGDAGFVTAWPAGEDQPTASALNVTGPRQTRSNFVILPVASDGYVSIVTQLGGHLLADVAGYFVAAPAATAGRIVTVAPQRLLDSRIAPGAPLGPERAVTLPVAAAPGGPVPAGAAAALVTLTVTDSAGEGYLTAWPTGTDLPLVSNVNVDGPAQTIANFAMVPLGAGGAIDLFASTGLHVVVDVVGYVTGAGAPSSATGLFVPVRPSRLFDTRLDVGVVPAGWSVSPMHAGLGPVPADAAAVFVNVTGIGATEVAHVRVWPAGGPLPLVSSVNLVPGDTRAAATLMLVGDAGRVTYWNSAGSLALAADVMGYVLQ